MSFLFGAGSKYTSPGTVPVPTAYRYASAVLTIQNVKLGEFTKKQL